MITRWTIGLYLLVGVARLDGQSPDLDQSTLGSGPFLSIDQSQWAIFRNMAGLAMSDSWQVMAGYQRPYNLSDLQSLSLGMVFPLKVALGASIYQSGSNIFRTQQIALNSAIPFNRVYLGMRVKYWRLTFAGLERLNSMSLDLGLQLQLSDKLVVGTFFSNITQSRIGSDQLLPVIWATGIQYQPSRTLIFSFEVEHRMAYSLEPKFGIEYVIKEKLLARTGINITNRQSFLGLRFKTAKVEWDYAITLQLTLGVIHQAGLSYSW